MRINSEQFTEISIRGRVAYGICCLENALQHFGIHGEGWNYLLEKLWWYTELPAACEPSLNNCLPLERWWALIGSILPSNYTGEKWDLGKLSEKLLCKQDLPTIEQLDLLSDSYNSSNPTVNSIVDEIYDIGTADLWAGICDSSPNTLSALQNVIDLMYRNNIPLPSVEPSKQYVFTKLGWDYDLHAFGKMFDGTQYSLFVKHDNVERHAEFFNDVPPKTIEKAGKFSTVKSRLKALKFAKISIRGRVAYGICCLENALQHFDVHGEGWNYLLEKLWQYTQLNIDCNTDTPSPLERWGNTIYNLTRPLLTNAHAWPADDDLKDYFKFEEDIPTKEERQLLTASYNKTNACINLLAEFVLNIGTRHAMTQSNGLKQLQLLLQTMYFYRIPLPSLKHFDKSDLRLSDSNVLGVTFDGTKYSRYLRSTIKTYFSGE